jgi:5-methylcytosine-specific restriction endonuclease McrA
MIKELNLSTAHFLGKGHLKGKTFLYTPKIPLDKILIKDSTYKSTHNLKNRLYKESILEKICSSCQLSSWLGEDLNLELDHINGDRTDNRLENLRILCRNCHGLTDTFAGLNKGKVNYNPFSKQSLNSEILNTKSSESILNERKFLCTICGLKKTKKSNSRCKECYLKIMIKKSKLPKSTKINWPSKEELEKLLWEKSTVQLAKQLGVSDKAIEKHAKKLGLTKPERGYWAKLYAKINAS